MTCGPQRIVHGRAAPLIAAIEDPESLLQQLAAEYRSTERYR